MGSYAVVAFPPGQHRLIHYPPLGYDDAAASAGGVRAAEHEDINLITLLCESTGAGLEILKKDGTWLAVDAPRGHLVVDTGDIMQRLTNGRIPSVTHRVVNPPDERRDVRRYSLPFFVHPRPEVVLETVPSCLRAGEVGPPAITADAFLRERLAAIGLAKCHEVRRDPTSGAREDCAAGSHRRTRTCRARRTTSSTSIAARWASHVSPTRNFRQ